MKFVRKSSSGEIILFLRVGKLKTGELFGIETRLPDEPKYKWDMSINLPMFKNYEDAEKWLEKNYELYP